MAKDLVGAFAQFPHLPKMLKADAIVDTLVAGCEHGAFVLRVTRPDGTFRTWWRSRPDVAALKDPALELVLPEAADLYNIFNLVRAVFDDDEVVPPDSAGSSLPASMKVLVMRGIGAWAKLSRRPLPVAGTPISRAFRRSCI